MHKFSGNIKSLTIKSTKINLFICSILIFLSLSFTTTVYSANVELAWNWEQPSGMVLDNYNLYQGTSSGNYTAVIDVGAQASYSVPNLVEGTTYYFSVTAKSADGLESAYSEELKVDIPDEDTSPQVAGVTLAWNWEQPSGMVLDNFNIYQGTSSGNYTTVIDVGTQTSYSVSNLIAGTTYYFSVTAKSTDGSESAYSAELKVDVPDAPPANTPPAAANCFLCLCRGRVGIRSPYSIRR